MKKLLIEYEWFKFYSKNDIGIQVGNRIFYATKRKANSCRYCEFNSEKEICDINVIRENNKPTTICYPCISKKYAFRGNEVEGNMLMEQILNRCQNEDYWDDFDLNELL